MDGRIERFRVTADVGQDQCRQKTLEGTLKLEAFVRAMGEASTRLKIECEHAKPTAKALLNCFYCVYSDGNRGGASDKQRGPTD